MTNILETLAAKYGTDKQFSQHEFTKYYHDLFKDKRESVLKVLEIGVFNGASLRMWKDYFPNATIYGLDINPECKKYEEDRIKIIISKQTEIGYMPKIVQDGVRFDLIIDDGSHVSDHQIESFQLLFPYLNCRGTYVIEDVCCSYWPAFNPTPNITCIEYFKRLIDEINFNGFMGKTYYRNKEHMFKSLELAGYTPSYYQKFIRKISFINGLIEIEKDDL